MIHNPDAGDDQQPSSDELLGLIRHAGHTSLYQSSKDENWQGALEQSCDIVAVGGGDGIVGTVAKNLIGQQVPIAVLPMGTANNIAKTLGLIDRPLGQLIAGWATAPRVKFDVGMASGPWNRKYFIEGLGVGLFSETMYRLDATNNVDLSHLDDTGEKVRSVLKILKERLLSFTPNRLKITLDGRDMSGEYIVLEVMNISYIGPNLCLAPHANLSDGLLDVVLVSKNEQDNFSRCLSHCIEGKLPYPSLTVRKAQHLQIEWDGFTVHIDDEVWPDKTSEFPTSFNAIDVKVNRHALEFLGLGK
ncbi:MAG TPA: diacylglycerol kinase family protein [Candidatus Binatia bacterium]|nr:diacylglycerol kinase family protein [Candidatus Binatia bacterium]